MTDVDDYASTIDSGDAGVKLPSESVKQSNRIADVKSQRARRVVARCNREDQPLLLAERDVDKKSGHL